MKIELTKINERMAPSGKAILRSLQNDSLPIVDLVIRESFQNSLDATLPNESSTLIDVSIKKIQTEKIAHYFEKISHTLIKRMPEDSTLIAIRDSNTYGLTGEFDTEDKNKLEKSNIYKLIYGLNMNQDKTDAGGSWGLGKTSFFRMGSGIVVYYSRVKLANGTFQERLAACLIENSEKKDAIMPENDRGVAWWGEKSSDDPYEKTIPITDSTKIAKMLNNFDIRQYTGSETGTTIIIPFIKRSNILVEEESKSKTPWQANLEESINIAIQRWYFPRIANQSYSSFTDQSLLIPTINGNFILQNDFSDTFKWFQSLYSAATQLAVKDGQQPDKNIKTSEIYLKQKGMVTPRVPIGYLAYTQLGINDLKESLGSGFISPHKYIGNHTATEENFNKGNILAYLRKPGMVVEYVVDNSDWLKGVPIEDNQFVLAIFVPNSNGQLHASYSKHYPTLESYLRDTENADHATWNDKIIDASRVTIVERTKKAVAKILSTELVNTEELSNKRTSALSRQFGNIYLPGANFGNAATVKKKPDRKKKRLTPSTQRAAISIKNIEFPSQQIRSIQFEAKLVRQADNVITLSVETSDKNYDIEDWTKTFEGIIPFPFKIVKLILTKYDDQKVNNVYDNFPTDSIASKFDIPNTTEKDIYIEGIIDIEIADLSVTPKISLKVMPHSQKGGDS